MKYIKYIILLLPLFIAGCGNGDIQNAKTNSAQVNKIYYCPMHPEVTSDKPGVCPICHMDLVLKTDDSNENENSADMAGMISLSSSKQVLANVQTIKVEEHPLTKTIKAYSYIDFAEPNKKSITARFNGRIEKLYVDQTGSYIKKGEPLFDVYSPDLVQAQNEYMIALKNAGQSMGNNYLIEAANKKLELFGFTQKQIDDLKNSDNIKTTFTYYSPYSGTVIDKQIQEGMYISEGTTIYNIAELSTIWNIAEVYENDIEFIKANSSVKLQLTAYPTETFKGKVNLIYPVVDPQTRTVKVRSEFPNHGNKLKPNMYGESFFEINLGKNILIPANAVIMTGKRNIVWIKIDSKTFEAQDVELGTRVDDKYQVLSGLNPGDEIVASGGYLIDSESQLKSGGVQTHNHTPDMNMKEEQMNYMQPESKQENHKEHFSHKSKNEKAVLINTDETPFNSVCPVLGNKISKKAPKVLYKGKIITFCCPGCDKKFIDNPEKYMGNLSADGKTFIGKIDESDNEE